MNLLLFETHERKEKGLALSGRRAEHLRSVLRVKAGDRVRVGELGGGQGWAEVSEISEQTIRLELSELGVAPRQQSPVSLLVAMPRPQSFKKILQVASSMGVESITFINSSRVEQAFFQSPVLQEEQIREHLLLGLEQAGSTLMPRVEIWQDFTPSSKCALQDRLDTLIRGYEFRGIAQPGASSSLRQAGPGTKSALFAIGPEGGWWQRELDFWTSVNFESFRLGPWVLRVETAISALLAQLEVMREIAGPEVGA